MPESDIIRLMMRSNMPDADVFQDWVCEEVIPTLRKTGALPDWASGSSGDAQAIKYENSTEGGCVLPASLKKN